MDRLEPMRPPTVVDLGIMQGPTPSEVAIDMSNWWDPPNQRWSFLHTREVMPSALVARGDGPVWTLPRDRLDLDGLPIELGGRRWTLREVLETSFTDGLMIVRGGAVVYEYLADGMDEHTRHICQSVSKSLTATLAGVLLADGRLDPDSTVPELMPELAGSCWEGCTVTHLLDMRAGVAFDESDYEDPDSESSRGFRVFGWSARRPDDPSPAEYLAGMHLQGPHGGDFEYRSILSQMLGLVIERAGGGRLAELFSREVWAPMGAADDADLLLGPGGIPLVDGGFCVTLSDLARLGLLHLRGGLADGRRVVPASWTRRVTAPDLERAAAFGEEGFAEDAYYRDQWWVLDPVRQIRTGYGIHGQQLLIHGEADIVVACFSSQPRPSDEPLRTLQESALLAVCDLLAEG